MLSIFNEPSTTPRKRTLPKKTRVLQVRPRASNNPQEIDANEIAKSPNEAGLAYRNEKYVKMLFGKGQQQNTRKSKGQATNQESTCCPCTIL